MVLYLTLFNNNINLRQFSVHMKDEQISLCQNDCMLGDVIDIIIFTYI